MQEENKILEYELKNEEAYNITNIIEIEKTKVEKKKKNYYEESIYALIQYMENNEINPSENRWNKYAICKRYLSSKTIGYLSGIGFNTLCRKLRKEINKKKRQTN